MSSTLSVGVASAEGRWRYPLDYKPQITSTFGTFRIGHHHAGLDLTTDGDESVDVLAADDGEIYRIKRSHSGYGRSVYVRHADGAVTVYGHLSAFIPALRAKALQAEKRAGAYAVAVPIRPPIPVRRGDPLGKVGTSGTDLVHLHFEVRLKGKGPVNPLRNGLEVPDTRKAKVRRIIAVPRSPEAHVNGTSDEVEIAVGPRGLETPLVVGGDVGLMVEAVDRIDGSARDLTPWRVGLRVDKRIRHHARYDRVTYGKRGHAHVELDFDPRRRAEGAGLFNKLYREGPRVMTWRKGGDWSLAGLSEGEHRAAIFAYDARDQGQLVKFSFKVAPAEPPCPVQTLSAWPEVAVTRAPPRTFRGSMVLVPVPRACEGGAAQIGVLFDGQQHPFRLVRHHGQPAVAVQMADGASGALEIALGGAVGVRHRVEVAGLVPEGVIQAGPVQIEVGGDSLFFPYPTEAVSAPGRPKPQLVPVGPTWLLANGWRPTRGSSLVGLPLPAGEPLDGLGVYLIEGARTWRLGAEVRQGRVFGRTVHLGQLALMRDTEGPIIGAPVIERHPAGPRLKIPVSDPGSGLASVEATLDGRPIHLERQHAYGVALWWPTAPLSGAERLEVVATDHAGRVSSRAFGGIDR